MSKNRTALIAEFLSRHNASGEPQKLREDASARRYYRVRRGAGSAIVMDAQPPFEEVQSFAEKSALFRQYGWHVPEIYAREDAAGLLLLEDFGDISFADAIKQGAKRDVIYKEAIDTLIHLHSQPNANAKRFLPELSDARLIYQASWLIEWYVPMVQPQTLSRVIREQFIELWMDAFKILRGAPLHAAHLDYQFHNLMRVAGKTGLEACGILDFQDACFGPVTADLVSLLKDPRADVADGVEAQHLDYYLAAFPRLDRAAFEASYTVFAAHNAARILGIFARLKMRDGNGNYLQHIPRNLKYFEESLRHPALSGLREWFDRYVPQSLRLNIPGLKAA